MIRAVAGITLGTLASCSAAAEADRAGTPAMESRCETEVQELHQFFQDWFNAAVAAEEEFARMDAVLARDFVLVAPDGSSRDRATTLEGVRTGYAVTSALGVPMRIWVRNVRARPLADGIALATYEEWQDSGGEVKGRLSTALFREKAGTPNGVEWLHVHETWLPAAD